MGGASIILSVGFSYLLLRVFALFLAAAMFSYVAIHSEWTKHRSSQLKVLLILLIILTCCSVTLLAVHDAWSNQRPLNITYQDANAFSPWQRFKIKNDLNHDYQRLVELGLPMSQKVPRIATLSAPNGTLSSIPLTGEGGFVAVSLRDPRALQELRLQYATLAIQRYVGVEKVFKYPDAQRLIAAYLNCSLRNQLDESCVGDWGALALLKLSRTYGQDWTDHVAVETLMSMHNNSTPPAFDDPLISSSTAVLVSPKYLFYHLRDGEQAMDADQSRIARFEAILSEQGIHP